jgi:hypothetical protein
VSSSNEDEYTNNRTTCGSSLRARLLDVSDDSW